MPFEVSLHLNGHDYLERQLAAPAPPDHYGRECRGEGCGLESACDTGRADLEAAVRRFAAYWVARLPHGLTVVQLDMIGGYYWYLQVLEVSHNFVFRSADQCRPVFETLLLHNQLLGSPDTTAIPSV